MFLFYILQKILK